MLNLLRDNSKVIQACMIKFIRTLIGHKDESIFKYLIKNNCFIFLFEIFEKYRSRENLIYSSILEILDFIIKSNIKPLINHILEKFESKLKGEEYNRLSTFKSYIEFKKAHNNINLDMHPIL